MALYVNGIKQDGGAVPTGSIDSAEIANGTIANEDVSPSAGIELSKLAALTVSRALTSNASGVITPATTTDTELGYVNGVTSAIQTQLNAKQTTTLADGKVLIGNVSNVAADVTPTGDVTITNAGVTAIGSGVVVNADVSGSAAIVQSKLSLYKKRFGLPYGAANAVTSTLATIGRVFLTEIEVETSSTIDGVIYNVGAVSNGNLYAVVYGPVSTDEVAQDLAVVVASASIAQATANTPQVLALAETVLVPGRYFIGIESDSATATFMRTSNVTGGQLPGTQKYYDRGGGYGAPTDPCPATTASESGHPWMAARFKTT